MILALRTDTMTAFLALLSPAGEILNSHEWEAGRQLSVQLPSSIDAILADSNIMYSDLTGIIVYEGPGSFTGLRIGITIANTIAHKQDIPIVGASGDDWLKQGTTKLSDADKGVIVMPVYGGEANITKPRK
jgi:tRNA threonylcarbamoyladenosine biosynthesis protein TsaB